MKIFCSSLNRLYIPELLIYEIQMRRFNFTLFARTVFFSWGLLLWVISFTCVSAQEKVNYRQYRFLEIKGHTGHHLYTGEALREALSDGYGALEARYGWQSNNPNSWQNMYLYPSYGFGWYSGFVGNPGLLGKPGAVYGFISFPLFQHRRHQMVIEPAAGISYDLKPYDANHNAQNDAIGSRVNVYFNLSVGALYRLNREMDLVYGIDFTHFSNGRVYKPNSGLNMFGPNLGIRYHFNALQNRVDNSYNPQTVLNVRPDLNNFVRAQKINTFNLFAYGAVGIVQNDPDMGTSKQYSTFSGLLELQYVLNTKNALTAGVDFFYDNSLVAEIPGEGYDVYGFHCGYDYMFWIMSFRLQVGSYFTAAHRDLKGLFFMRPAVKLDITRRLYIQLGLKTLAGAKADWVEWGLGLKLAQFGTLAGN